MNYTFLFGISCNSGRDLRLFCYTEMFCVSLQPLVFSWSIKQHLLEQPYTVSNVSIYFVISFAHYPLPLLFFVCQLSKCII